jgi:hypothetical protein
MTHPFLGAACSADNWGALAERLRRAADVVLREKQTPTFPDEDLRPSPSPWLGAIHMMLLGQAVEVAAKGLLVAQDPAWVDTSKPKSPFRWSNWGHDLVRLLGETKVTVSPSEKQLADLLREFVEWGGRYPSPKNPANGEPLRWNPGDVASAEALYDRLDAARRLLPSGPQDAQ